MITDVTDAVDATILVQSHLLARLKDKGLLTSEDVGIIFSGAVEATKGRENAGALLKILVQMAGIKPQT